MDKSISGQLSYFPINDVITLISQSLLSGILIIVTEKGTQGRICFDNGKLVHADLFDIVGKEALLHMLSWNEGEFSFYITPYNDEVTIKESFDSISLSHLIFEDEKNAKKNTTKVDETWITLAKQENQPNSVQLEPNEWSFLLQIGKGCSLTQIASDLKISTNEANGIVAKLLKLELIKVSTRNTF